MKQDTKTHVCTLSRNKASVCTPQTVEECDRCGWEQTEILRRKEVIQADWTKPNMEAGEYCLKIRKEKKHG